MYSGTGVWDGQAYWQSMTRWKYSGSEIFVGFTTTAHLKHESCGENGNVFPYAPVDCGSTTEHRRLPAASGLSRHPCQPIAAPRFSGGCTHPPAALHGATSGTTSPPTTPNTPTRATTPRAARRPPGRDERNHLGTDNVQQPAPGKQRK